MSVLAWYLLQSFHYAVQRYYNADELRYGHAAWLVAEGYRPYVDFWDAKFPFMYQFMSLIFAFTDDHPGNIIYLRIIMFLMLCITVFQFTRSTISIMMHPRFWPLLCYSLYGHMFSWLLRYNLMEWLQHYISDQLQHCTRQGFLLLCVALSGILFALCLWTSQKAFCYGLIFPIALIIDIFINFKTRRGYLLGSPLSFFLVL